MQAVLSALPEPGVVSTDEVVRVLERASMETNIRSAASLLGHLAKHGLVDKLKREPPSRYARWRAKQLRAIA